MERRTVLKAGVTAAVAASLAPIGDVLAYAPAALDTSLETIAKHIAWYEPRTCSLPALAATSEWEATPARTVTVIAATLIVEWKAPDIPTVERSEYAGTIVLDPTAAADIRLGSRAEPEKRRNLVWSMQSIVEADTRPGQLCVRKVWHDVEWMRFREA